MSELKCWVTRRYNGLYLVTAFKPVIREVAGTGHDDAYIKYGDPVGYINVSKLFGESVFGDLPDVALKSYRAIMYGSVPNQDEEMTHILVSNFDTQLYSIQREACSIDNVCQWFVKKMFGVDTLWYKPCPLIFKGKFLSKIA